MKTFLAFLLSVSFVSATDSAGTYNPTITQQLNLDDPDAVLTSGCMYIQVDNVVHVSCYFETVDPTSSNISTTFAISLPISSSFTIKADCAGVGTSSVTSTTETAQVSADLVYGGCIVKFVSVGTASRPMSVMFTYKVL